jgi:hypothetical protein
VAFPLPPPSRMVRPERRCHQRSGSLIDSEVLDSFCMIAEVVHMPPVAKSA